VIALLIANSLALASLLIMLASGLALIYGCAMSSISVMAQFTCSAPISAIRSRSSVDSGWR